MSVHSRHALLAIGNGSPATGYGRVLRSLLPRVGRGLDVVHFTVDLRDPPAGEGWRIEPNRLAGDLGGIEQLPAILERHRPRVVWICHDLWLWRALAPALRGARPRPRVVLFTPLDGGEHEPDVPELLAGLEHLVLYTDHARARVERLLCELPAGARAPAVSVLPHGVDRLVFRPLRALRAPADLRHNRRIARARLFPARPELRDGFVVLNANRNTLRKRIDLTLAGFARFARGKQDVFLALHMGARDQGVDVVQLARELGIGDRVLLTGGEDLHRPIGDRELNCLYNACDVGVNTAAKEGWGLVALEHAAAGAAQLVPALPSCREIWRERAGLIGLARDARGWRAPDPSVLAELLKRLYASPRELWRWTLAAHERARRPHSSWGEIAHEWAGILDAAAATGV